MRNIKQLHPKLQETIKAFLKKCELAGLKVGISECLRTVQEQNDLYAQGRTKSGKIVTNASGSSYSSLHQWGVAFDFYRNDEKGAYNDSGNFFYKVGQIGKQCGLFWGGDFKSISDRPHFQMKEFSPDGTASYLKKKYGNPSAFMKTWEKKEKDSSASPTKKPTTIKKNPYAKPSGLIKKGDKGNKVKWLQWELIESGFKLTIDGDFGKATKKAVMDFQKSRKIGVDGIVGNVTISKLIVDK